LPWPYLLPKLFIGKQGCYLFCFRNFPCIHSFPQPKDIIVTSGLLAFICFCDGWGAGPPHQPPNLGDQDFLSLSLWCPHTTLARQQDL
jgi:hypothetical protein